MNRWIAVVFLSSMVALCSSAAFAQPVLVIDTDTFEFTLQSTGGPTVMMDGYTIQTFVNDPLFDVASWMSLQDHTLPGWTEANPTSTILSELNLTDSLEFSPGTAVSLGFPVLPEAQAGFVPDLTFEYTATGSDIPMQGFVVYVETVPEPVSVTMLLSLAALAGARRVRK